MSRILVVDDEDSLRKAVAEALESEGYNVSQACDGKEAQKVIYEKGTDLVVSDVVMPQMDGFELCREIKFLNNRVKFIIITGYHKKENIPICLQYNVSRYIKKPFRIRDILLAVKESLQEEDSKNIFCREDTCLEGWLEIEIESSEASLIKGCHFMEQYLKDRTPEQISGKIVYSFNEMLKNAIEWGNTMKKEYLVSVGCMVINNKVVIKIHDEGKGFNIKEAFNKMNNPVKLQKDRMAKGKRPGGFGISIARKFMDDFFYNEKGNCLIMTKNID